MPDQSQTTIWRRVLRPWLNFLMAMALVLAVLGVAQLLWEIKQYVQ